LRLFTKTNVFKTCNIKTLELAYTLKLIDLDRGFALWVALEQNLMGVCKIRNTPGTPRNTPEHLGTPPEHHRNSPEQPGATPEHPWNIP